MYDSLIRHLRYFQYVTHCHATTEKCAACQYKGNVCGMAEYTRHEILGVAADAITALQAENGSLRAQHRTEHCEAVGYDCVELGRLRDALASVEAERDALLEAVESGKDCAYCIVGNGGREPQCEAAGYCCDGCADMGCRCHDCTDGSRFQWRGAQGEG